ncbi:MAG: CDP-glycerol glycerophosphotransferase family protein [bacterium]
MKKSLIKFSIIFFNFLYFFFKFIPQKKIITILSRQSDQSSIDIEMIKEDLNNNLPDYKVIVLCKKLEGNIIKKSLYFFHILKQMYYISQSKLLILDSYCITASMLKHKTNIQIIQIWHALGLMKKAGYSILDKKEGRSKDIALTAKMHHNYTYAITSSEHCIKSMSKVYNINEDKILVYKLPRVDYLINNKDRIGKEIKNKYTNLNDKKNILYIPTHRKGNDEFDKEINVIIDTIDFKKYNLIIKLHPLSNIDITNPNVTMLDDIKTVDTLFIADYVITDYSTICYEAMILNIPVYFYAFDLEQYTHDRDFFIDYKKDLKDNYYLDFKKLYKSLDNNKFNFKKQETLLKQQVDLSADKISDFVIKTLKGNNLENSERN